MPVLKATITPPDVYSTRCWSPSLVEDTGMDIATIISKLPAVDQLAVEGFDSFAFRELLWYAHVELGNLSSFAEEAAETCTALMQTALQDEKQWGG